jgi:glycosyltransferase involved in cell wall biosynthesis
MKPLICHISTVHPDDDIRIFYRECSSLAATGYRVVFIVPSENRKRVNEVDIVPLPRIKNRLFRMLILPWIALWKTLLQKPAICHYHDPELMPIGFILRWVFQKNVVYDIHESVYRQTLNKTWIPKYMRSAVANLYRFAEPVLTVGQELIVVRNTFAADYSKPVYTVHNYPSFEMSGQPDTMEKKFDCARPLLVYVGDVSEIRGAFVYLDLAEDLVNQGREFEMILIGQYDEQTGLRVKNIIRDRSLHDNVKLTGRLPFPEAMMYVSRADIGLCLLLPATHYSVGLATKIFEYMMLGVPVLSSNIDIWRKYVEEENAGMMVNPCDRRAVLETCNKMLQDPCKLEIMGKNGKRAIREKYNWKNEFETLLQCYNKLLNISAPKH